MSIIMVNRFAVHILCNTKKVDQLVGEFLMQIKVLASSLITGILTRLLYLLNDMVSNLAFNLRIRYDDGSPN